MLIFLLAGAASAQPIVWSGSVRTRMEAWRWFEGAGDNAYAYSGTIARVAFTQQFQTWDWQVELAAPVLLGLPERAIAPPPQLQLGFGGNYYAANDRSRNAAMIFPKQAFARFKDVLANGDSLRLGRFEFIDGAEVAPKNPTLAALKRDRIAHRLLGNFAFSHVGRSYDGAHYSWTQAGRNFTLTGMVPTRGVLQVDGWGNLAIPIVYGAFTDSLGRRDYDAEWRLFGMYYEDTRAFNLRIGTFGGHYIGEIRREGGALDVLFWGAAQTGRWGGLDQRGWAFAADGGWQPDALPRLRPWLRFGYAHSSGDRNPLDDKRGTFFQVLPTPRIYARMPFFNLMNIRDAFVSAILRPNKRVTVRTDLRGLWLANRRDNWYQGGGAFQPWTFGYTARPSGGRTGLATLWDISVDWNVNPAVLVYGYFAHAAGGDVVKRIYTGSGANLGYVELTYRF